jgi:hypothetical protein
MIKKSLFCCLIFLMALTTFAQSEDLLKVLETPVATEAFMFFRAKNQLDNSLSNPRSGLKLYTDANHQKVKAVMFTNANQNINQKIFNRYNGTLPFNLSFNYSFNDIRTKVEPTCISNAGFACFKRNNILVTIDFADPLKMDSILSISYRYDTIVATKQSVNVVASDIYANTDTQNTFKSSILGIFASAQNYDLKNVLQYKWLRENIWNYTHTYRTTISVPGELYNFVYSFPFENSQRDFVCVLAETHHQIQPVYDRYADLILSSFPVSEGWEYSYHVNKEKPNAPRDLIMRHPKIGTFVLDYTMSPYGVEVVYLRFLFLYH